MLAAIDGAALEASIELLRDDPLGSTCNNAEQPVKQPPTSEACTTQTAMVFCRCP